MRHPEPHIFHLDPPALREWVTSQGMAPFRADQILEWVYRRGVVDPGAMTNLSARDRETLGASMTMLSGEPVRHQVATDGTQKLLVQWSEPQTSRSEAGPGPATAERSTPLPQIAAPDPSLQTECVMIPALDTGPGGLPTRRTACISSQVGCPVGCRFCASGLGGLDGNLSAGRIVEQVWSLSRLPGVQRITNIVFMGMGEPLANLPNVVKAVHTIAADWGMGISARKITISTVGLPAAIEKLASRLDLPVTLALSLHAPNDDLRRELIPWASHATIPDILDACRKWFEKTGREITLEYILLGGVNDQASHAEELSRVAKSLRANINLIRYNEVDGLPFTRPRDEDVRTFQQILRDRGCNSHIRASRGRDIAAACGQLRHEASKA